MRRSSDVVIRLSKRVSESHLRQKLFGIRNPTLPKTMKKWGLAVLKEFIEYSENGRKKYDRSSERKSKSADRMAICYFRFVSLPNTRNGESAIFGLSREWFETDERFHQNIGRKFGLTMVLIKRHPQLEMGTRVLGLGLESDSSRDSDGLLNSDSDSTRTYGTRQSAQLKTDSKPNVNKLLSAATPNLRSNQLTISTRRNVATFHNFSPRKYL
jgi:hypothetical protein